MVVTRLDRLGRDAVDVVQTVGAVRDGGQVVVLQLGNVDLTSSAGKLILSISYPSVAEMERNLIRERWRGLAAAQEKRQDRRQAEGATETQRQQIAEMSATGKPDATLHGS